MSVNLVKAFGELRRDEILASIKTRVGKGEGPMSILDDCRKGMTAVGEGFQRGDFFLAELMLSAQIFQGVMQILEPEFKKTRPEKPLGMVVLATLQGDIHDLGKNILATLLSGQGFAIHDLGVDVPPKSVVEKVKAVHPDFVGFSALITTAFEPMREAAQMLEEAGLRNTIKLMVGGGVTTEHVKDYIGADFQTLNAADGVDYCMRIKGDK